MSDAAASVQDLMNAAAELAERTRATEGKVSTSEKNESLKRTLAFWTLAAFTSFVGLVLLVYAVRFVQLTFIASDQKGLLTPDKSTQLKDIGGQMVDVIKTFYVPVITLILGYFFGRGGRESEPPR